MMEAGESPVSADKLCTKLSGFNRGLSPPAPFGFGAEREQPR